MYVIHCNHRVIDCGVLHKHYRVETVKQIRVISVNFSDNEFFEDYKKLDKLCGEMFGCGNGISEYISRMEKTARGPRLVPTWKTDLYKLKKIRSVRNKIAHEASRSTISSIEDISFAKSFYTRMMKQRDPLSELKRVKQERGGRSQNAKYNRGNIRYENNAKKHTSGNEKRESKSTDVILFLLGMVILISAAYVFIRYFLLSGSLTYMSFLRSLPE